MTYCKNCGQELQLDWILCPKCDTQAKVNQQLKSNQVIIGILLQFGGFCILILGILFSLYFWVIFIYNYNAYQSEDGPGMAIEGSTMMLAISFIMITVGLSLISKKVKFVINKSELKPDKEKLKLNNTIEKPYLNLGLFVSLFGTTFKVIWGIILSFSDPAPLGFQIMFIIGFIITIVGVLLI